MDYLIIKALHITAFTCWFAMLFYLPRLFVYHTQIQSKAAESHQLFSIMELKLLKIIGYPAAFATIFFGFWLWEFNDFKLPHWLLLKLLLVLVLCIFHGYCHYFQRQFQKSRPLPSARFFRFFNEVPTIILLAIVFLVVLKV